MWQNTMRKRWKGKRSDASRRRFSTTSMRTKNIPNSRGSDTDNVLIKKEQTSIGTQLQDLETRGQSGNQKAADGPWWTSHRSEVSPPAVKVHHVYCSNRQQRRGEKKNRNTQTWRTFGDRSLLRAPESRLSFPGRSRSRVQTRAMCDRRLRTSLATTVGKTGRSSRSHILCTQGIGEKDHVVLYTKQMEVYKLKNKDKGSLSILVVIVHHPLRVIV
jgi:hypothetical protein